ncbi:hypothetical protein [Gemmatimonas sp.]|uniref:hypothetical protein n=1 Tax=Gemmatimonas sp. TaxID=1962908 RepID=UPI00286E34C1|nr:hypothetical protein [Gemmatimonas sp.]
MRNAAIQCTRFVLALVLTLCVAACDSLVGPEFPSGNLVELQAPPEFTLWWSLVEQCSGRRGSLAAVQFFRTRDPMLIVDGKRYDGYWWSEGNRVALVTPEDGATVRHEMLHALLQRGDHAPEYFAGRCDGWIRFDHPGTFGVPASPEAAVVSGTDALRATLTTLPAAPRASEFRGAFVYLITAESVRTAPVWVPVTNGLLATVFVTGNPIGMGAVTTATRLFFAPSQRRQALIDARITDAGYIDVVGSYVGAATLPQRVEIAP